MSGTVHLRALLFRGLAGLGLVVGLGIGPAAVAPADEPIAEVDLLTTDVSLPLDGSTAARVEARHADGTPVDLESAEITVSSSDPRMAAVELDGAAGTVRAGTAGPGEVTLTAAVSLDGVTVTDQLELTIRPEPAVPFVHDYHQTLTMKMFMADNQGRVSLTFEEGLEVIEKVDNLTRGIPKIFYLVGWQYDGHDTGYPAWDVVNPKLKRAEDDTALDSLNWLIEEARKYNTTVSFHINMFDAAQSSPLWDTYVDADVIARNADGSLREYVWGHPISYTREWDEGLTTRRIDTLFDMVDMPAIGTVHVDAFHQIVPNQGTGPLSPYHGITTAQEIETQKKILRYWRDRGADVTSEFTYSYREDPLLGLQPMAWHFRNVDQMEIPPTLHIGGAGGDQRFGASMQGESRIRQDPDTLSGFLDDFATSTPVWYYLNRLERISDEDGVVTFEGGVTSRNVDGGVLVQRGDVVLRDGNDTFVPALWNEASHREILAYSRDGYASRTWRLPDDWADVALVDIYRVGLDGLTQVARNERVSHGQLTLSVPAGTSYSIVPAGTDIGDADRSQPYLFDALRPANGSVAPDPHSVVFTWRPSHNADDYRLMVATDEDFDDVVADQVRPGVAAVVRSLDPGTTYYWKVEAHNAAGTTTINAAPLTFRTAVTEPPGALDSAAAYRVSDESVLVTWGSATGAQTYTVARRPVGTADFTTVAEGVTGTSFLDETAPRDQGPFEYQVVGVNELGAGPASGPAAERDVDLSQGTYLSDLDWVSASSGWRSVARDGSVSGGGIRIDGTAYEKGLGTHAVSEIVYDLGEAISASAEESASAGALFRAVVGIDDAKANSPASIVFRVSADGELLYDSGVIRSQPYTPPKDVLVDVSGHDQLVLQVLDAGDGINSDHADWADAQLVPLAD